MSRKLKIILIIFIVVMSLVLFIAAILTPSNNSNIDGQTTPTPQARISQQVFPTSIQPTGVIKYSDFIKGGMSEVCNFVTNVEGSLTTGTLYAGNGKIRADFVTTTSSGTYQQHMVVDSYLVYLWTNIDNKGVKFIAKEISDGKSLKDSFGADNVSCQEWRVDNNVFQLPPQIVFSEISQNTLIDNLIKENSNNNANTENVNNNLCSSCEALEDQGAREVCRAQYNCQ